MLRRLQALSTPIRIEVSRLVSRLKPKLTRVSARRVNLPNHWHAVCVQAKPLSCPQAHELHKKRFLSKEAPSLPLEGCDNRANCPCTYKHYEDRRGKPRRKGQASFSSTQKIATTERRNSKGRRSDD
jgi:hypothetical protein